MILLLGASGLLGHNVLRLLLERGLRVRVLLRPGSDLLPLEGVSLSELEAVRGSLLDYPTLLRAAEGCEAVINCAGTTDMRLPRVEDFYPVNRDLPSLLGRLLVESGVRTLVHTSTANTIAAGTRMHPTDESAPFAAPFDRSPYAISKREGEERLLSSVPAGRRVIIVCPGFLLGPYDAKPSSATLLLAACRRNPVRSVARRSAAPGDCSEAPVGLSGGALPFRVRGRALMAGPRGGKSFLHVRDAATAIANALERGESGRYLLTGESLTLQEFYALQAQVCGYHQRFLPLPDGLVRAVGRLGDALGRLGIHTLLCTHNTDQLLIEEWYDTGKAERELGLPHTPVAQAIRDYFTWRHT